MMNQFVRGVIAAVPLLVGTFAGSVSGYQSGLDGVEALPLGEPPLAFQLASGDAGNVVEASTGLKLSFEAFVEQLRGVDVVLIGEHHTNMEGHEFQWKLFEAISISGVRAVLGMEFFEVGDDAALARFVSGELDTNGMLEATGWYEGGAYSFEYYRPMLETARRVGGSIKGLNVPRDWVRAVSRSGYDALTAEQKALIGPLQENDPAHAYMIDRMTGGLGATMPSMQERIYAGQRAWDSAMATSILRALGEGTDAESPGPPRVVCVIVGSGHIAHGRGIPRILRERAPHLQVRTVAPVMARKPDPDDVLHPGMEPTESAVFSRGYADFVYVLHDAEGYEAFPTLGAQVKAEDGALLVASVREGGLAARADIRVGDRIVSFEGEPTPTATALYSRFASGRWNERVLVGVVRDGEALTVPMIVAPPTDGDLDWLESEVASALLDTFDPRSSRGYGEESARPQGFHARLVRKNKTPVRVDILKGGVLMEAWTLDEKGRPVLGVFAKPAADGAVRVELERDESGAVVAERRTDERGEVIALKTPPVE